MARLLAVAILAAGLGWAAAVSTTTCPVPAADLRPTGSPPSTANTLAALNGVNAATQRQVIEWCRYAEGGKNTNYTRGTRAWGSASSALGAIISGFPGQVAAGAPGCIAGPNQDNSTCNATAAAGTLDGPGGQAYRFGSPACSTDANPATGGYLEPTTCDTDDKWGTNPTVLGQVNDVCIIPGQNKVYPATFDIEDVCDHTVLKYDLVTDDGREIPLGQLLIFKDYYDQLYLTVTLNGTFRSDSAAGVDNGTAASFFNGQYLHVQPNLVPSSDGTAGKVYLWNQFPNKPTYQYKNIMGFSNDNMAAGFTKGIYSCFTYKINTRTVCNPNNNITWVPDRIDGSCVRADGTPLKSTDVAGNIIDCTDPLNSQYLFLLAMFQVTKFTMALDMTTPATKWSPMNVGRNYTDNIVCPADLATGKYFPRLMGCGCMDLNTQPPPALMTAPASTVWLKPKVDPTAAVSFSSVLELYSAGLTQKCFGKPRPPRLPGAPTPPTGPTSPAPSPSPSLIPSPSPVPPASPVVTPPPAQQLFTCTIKWYLDTDFYRVDSMPLSPNQLDDAMNRTFADTATCSWWPSISMHTSVAMAAPTCDGCDKAPLGYQQVYYFQTLALAQAMCTDVRNKLPLFIWFASIPCGTTVDFTVANDPSPNPAFPYSKLACFATEPGVLSVESLCLKPKGNQICATPVVDTAGAGYSPMPPASSPVNEPTYWPTPPAWYEYIVSMNIRQDNGLVDVASGNKQGTINKVYQNLCPYFKKAVLEGLNRVGAPPEAYIDMYGDQFNGCGDILLNQPADNKTVPSRVYVKAFLNISSTQYGRMKKKFSFMQSRVYVQDAHLLCNSNITWVDTVSTPGTRKEDVHFTQVGLPWLRKDYSPLSCKLTIGL